MIPRPRVGVARQRRRVARAAGAAACTALLVMGVRAASAQAPLGVPETAAVARLNQEVAFTLFTLTNSGFSAGGFASYDDGQTDAKFNIYGLPLRTRVRTELLGPIELRLSLTGGQAETNVLQDLGGGALVADRTLQTTWNARVDIGRPFELLPGLEFLPMVGIGGAHWSGKWTRSQAGAVPVADGRVDFWTNAMVYEAIGILEYTHRWRDLTIRPGVAVNQTRIDSVQGRANLVAQPGVPAARAPVGLSGSSTLVRAALRVNGPTGIALRGTALLWEGFVVAGRETTGAGLFPWWVELGGALGVDAGPLGRRWLGFDPGGLYLGASYIVGENLQGARVNFGFRF